VVSEWVDLGWVGKVGLDGGKAERGAFGFRGGRGRGRVADAG
jgi:hypothetical protein